MPIYTYRCRECDHSFERNQRMSDMPLADCPVCDGSVRRVINSVGVVFKGSGFYVTDNRNGNGKLNGSSVNGSTAGAAKDDRAANGAANGDANGGVKVEASKNGSESKAPAVPPKREAASAAVSSSAA
jgi:putative FmdB family regulatory protein